MSNCPLVRCAVGTATTLMGLFTSVTLKVPVTCVAEIAVTVELDAAIDAEGVKVHVNGEPVAMQRSGTSFHGRALVPADEHGRVHSVWRGSYGSIVTAIVRLPDGRTFGTYAVTGGIG